MKNNELLYEDLDYDQDDQEYNDQDEEDQFDDQQKKQLSSQQYQDSLKTASTRHQEKLNQKEQIREGLYDDPQLAKERKTLWKTFGMNNPAGKELYKLYKCHQQPQIHYPKPKQKTKEQIDNERSLKDKKSCPQKTQIEYPTIERQRPQFHMIDFVPKKKREAEIRIEIEKYYQGRKFWRPAIQGQDRKKLIEELQIKFKYLRGALPKGAELPAIDITKDTFDDAKSKANAIRRTLRKDLYFTGMKGDDQTDKQSIQSSDPLTELNVLFDAIIREIEERQEFLEDIEQLDEVKLKQRIKDEIVERVAELQKITEMKKNYK